MFSITVFHGPHPLVFLFKTKETFEAQRFNPRLKWWSITDDFGQHGDFNTLLITGVCSEDMEQSKLATIERSLHVARIQAQTDTRGRADPALQHLYRGSGPAMIAPAGLNGRGMM